MMMNDFDKIMQKSYGYDSAEFYSSANWGVVRQLFKDNYHPNGVTYRIPKKIHQIWLGSPLPEVYREYTESWVKFHPDWEYKLWTDKDVKGIRIMSKQCYRRAVNPAMKSDILRYEILRQIGGIYVDTDFECLKPFDDLMYLDFFTGVGYDCILQLYNGLIASVPNHPIMNDCANITSEYQGKRGSIILNETGANYFTKCFLRSVTGKVVAFPIDYFYPFPNHLRGKDNPYKYVTENSYAIHHWAVSWSRRNQRRLKLNILK